MPEEKAIFIADVEKAYEAVGDDPDYPDTVILLDGRCPKCRELWQAPHKYCLYCGFPNA